MKIKEYNSDPSYWSVWEKMQLLGIEDVSTERQAKNGTVVWQLPIKNNWPGNQANASFIKVASFSTGYVRNQNSGYSNYQLNKRCESKPQYYKLSNGDYRKYTTRACELIPIEIDRLEYLITYCLKNYYIKHANQVAEGKYVTKWEHEYMLENANSPTVTKNLKKISESNDRIYELESQVDFADTKMANLSLQNEVLQNKLSNAISATKHECTKQYSVKLEEKLYNLQNKLATIERIANDTNEWNG